MFARTKSVHRKLDGVIDKILDEMDTYGPDSPEYPQLLEHLSKVVALRSSNDRKRLTPDGAALVVGGIVQVVIIGLFEQNHVLGSKGLGFVLKSQK